MRNWVVMTVILALGGILAATDVEARRLGGGRTMGAQRNVTPQQAQTPAKPAQQQQAAPAQQGTQPAAAAQTGNRWLPILGGLALGGVLGYLFGGNGLMGILLIAGLAILAVMVVRALMARRRQQEVLRPVQYAGMRESVEMPMQASAPAPISNASIPAGFDATGFLRAAKMNFLKLQHANDAGRLDEIREFTTDELYEELRKDFGRSAGQTTDIASLDADLLEFATEGNRHWASVRFSGMVREAPRAEPEAFTEVWNLVKPADGSTGWLLAGIQQMH
ncbi:MAG TPA: TIM44-like domain-containing protein [Burkholderiales bacterium]|nr:TIM44-like domain-containing protein [Burkholderiales bacterium]